MAWGNIFGNVNQGQLQSALARSNPYGGGAQTIGGGAWEAGQPLVQNPTQLSDNDVRRAIAASKGSQAAGAGGGGGMASGIMGAMGAMGGGGGGGSPPPQTAYPRYASTDPYFEPEELRGKRHQQEGIQKIGMLLSMFGGGMGGAAGAMGGLGK